MFIDRFEEPGPRFKVPHLHLFLLYLGRSGDSSCVPFQDTPLDTGLQCLMEYPVERDYCGGCQTSFRHIGINGLDMVTCKALDRSVS